MSMSMSASTKQAEAEAEAGRKRGGSAPGPVPAVYALGSNGSGQLGIGHTEDTAWLQECRFQSRCRAGGVEGVKDGEDKEDDDDDDDGDRAREAPLTMAPEYVDVKKIVAGGNHTLLLTKDGQVFSAGKFGCEASEESTTVFVQRHFDFRTNDSHVRAHFFTPSKPEGSPLSDPNHLQALTTSGSVQTLSGRITDIAATWDASFVVVDHKVVFVCGTGSKGELGLGEGVERAETITKVFDVAGFEFDHDTTDGSSRSGDGNGNGNDKHAGVRIRIRAIAACMAHVVVLLSNGHVFGWGNCRKGQLGERVKNRKVLWTPTRIDHDLDAAIKVSRDSAGSGWPAWTPERVVVGREYTVFLKTGETPVVWGDTRFIDGESELLKRPLEDGDRVVSAWGSIHVYSPRRGSVHSAGRNHRGQLAPSGLPAIQDLAAGSEHCIALTTDNQVIAWGWGEHGNCGGELDEKGNVAGRWNVIETPRLADESLSLTVKGVSAGCATSFVVCGIKGR
ncbi:hypothetical protein A1O3_07318 [Capronia epimyces CBS 606.96]|uniref:Uncharacterized protein n=1 Tax=Capronia epimyces CBS 606.96 TaxID=1182542 RepID=W9XUL1_9EURO|nr:uncharacterized protein A1O3_07318 [Capronia epimyces CBS 606.96]EXJ81030.1 hypothetical protein A1O3_07318 [Capronia epimyces CBS 606.96]